MTAPLSHSATPPLRHSPTLDLRRSLALSAALAALRAVESAEAKLTEALAFVESVAATSDDRSEIAGLILELARARGQLRVTAARFPNEVWARRLEIAAEPPAEAPAHGSPAAKLVLV